MKPTVSFVFFFLIFILLVGHTIAQAQQAASLNSGLSIGANCPAFDPVHVWGPDKGTKACPMCRYGQQQGVMIWINTSNLTVAGNLAERLEQEINHRGLNRMRAFIIFMNPEKKPGTAIKKMLTDFSSQHKLNKVAVTYIPDPTDEETAGLYEINPDTQVQNTVLVYKRRGIYRKFINMKATNDEIDALVNAITTAEKDNNF